MNHLANAVAIASKAHLTHKPDKGGSAYILHPLRMMMRMDTDEERMVAVLHDVVEDHRHEGYTFESLAGEGIPECVLAALRCVTKTDDEERRGDAAYDDFIRRAATNAIARRVKLADLEDNMNIMRLEAITPRDVVRLEKYHRSWKYLKSIG